jgi:prepilin-type N-terminal cleavage/methylation domain-containing protein
MKLRKFAQEVTGFTLIEVLATISIAGILVGIAIPRFSALLPGIRLASAARQVATDLQLARMRAISQHANQTVTITSATNYTFGTEARNLSVEYPGTTIGITSPPSSTTVSFTTLGGSTAATTITLTNKGVTKQVQVTTIGRVNIP